MNIKKELDWLREKEKQIDEIWRIKINGKSTTKEMVLIER